MQIKKTKKPSNILFDDDFASGFEDSRFEKFKPIVKILVTAIVIVGISCTYFLFSHRSGDTKNLNDTYTSNPSQTSADNKAAQDGRWPRSHRNHTRAIAAAQAIYHVEHLHTNRIWHRRQ